MLSKQPPRTPAGGSVDMWRTLMGGAIAFIIVYLWLVSGSRSGGTCPTAHVYDDTYPATKLADGSFRIATITDLDKASKVDATTWHSFMQKGTLKKTATGTYTVEWDSDRIELKSNLGKGGRGMELSDLVWFNNKLYTCDDRTGVVYELEDGGGGVTYNPVPRHILMEGSGDTLKELKCEWMSVKDGVMYVGAFGKEFVDGETGLQVESAGPMWVVSIDVDGRLTHEDWRPRYTALRKATGTEHPAYLWHESAEWSAVSRRWFFLPRRVSKVPYNEVGDETKGSNLILSIDENFDPASSKILYVGSVLPSHGFSAFRFIPGDEEEIVAIKTVELSKENRIESYVMVFDLSGDVLLDETKMADEKFEGIEFI